MTKSPSLSEMLTFHEKKIKEDREHKCLCQCCYEGSNGNVQNWSTWLWCHQEFGKELHVNHLCASCCEDMKKYSKNPMEVYYAKQS